MFKISVKGESSEPFEFGDQCIKTVKLKTDLPLDSDARTKDVGSTLTIKGKILSAYPDGSFDATKQLGLWSLIASKNPECYREVEVKVSASNQVIRKITFPNAFIVDYKETFSDEVGVGEFILVIKQKKDKLASLKVEGGFEDEE